MGRRDESSKHLGREMDVVYHRDGSDGSVRQGIRNDMKVAIPASENSNHQVWKVPGCKGLYSLGDTNSIKLVDFHRAMPTTPAI